MPHSGEIKTRGVAIYRFLFSNITNAFAEPAVIESGKSILEIANQNVSLCSFGLKVINYGGPSHGLDVVVKTSHFATTILILKLPKSDAIRKRE